VHRREAFLRSRSGASRRNIEREKVVTRLKRARLIPAQFASRSLQMLWRQEGEEVYKSVMLGWIELKLRGGTHKIYFGWKMLLNHRF